LHRRSLLWLASALLYAFFFAWYTDLAGPLGNDEIDSYRARLGHLGFEPSQIESVTRFMQADTGAPFLMVNLVDLEENPPTLPAFPDGANAETLIGHYMEHMIPELFSRASHPVLLGDVIHPAMDLAGLEGTPGIEHWESAVVMRYRSRRALLEVITTADMRDRHSYKIAALEKTIAVPIEARWQPGDPRILLGLALLAGTALADIALYGRRRGA